MRKLIFIIAVIVTFSYMALMAEPPGLHPGYNYESLYVTLERPSNYDRGYEDFSTIISSNNDTSVVLYVDNYSVSTLHGDITMTSLQTSQSSRSEYYVAPNLPTSSLCGKFYTTQFAPDYLLYTWDVKIKVYTPLYDLKAMYYWVHRIYNPQ